MDELKKAIETGLAAVETKLRESLAQYEAQLKDAGTVAADVRAAVSALSEQYKGMRERMLELEQKRGTMQETSAPAATWGNQLIGSAEFKAAVAAGGRNLNLRIPIEVKNTVVNGSGTTFPYQQPGVIPGGFVPQTVRSVLSSIPVSTNAVNSLRELLWTNSAAEVSEGAAKPESDITFEPYDVNIRTVAHFIKVSNQLLADAPAIAAYIDTRLRDGLAQRVEFQLVRGNGTSPNISGLTDSGNFTAYTPTSDDNLADAVSRIKYTMWAAGYAPSVVFVNPSDWGALERLREGTASGAYLYGPPGTVATPQLHGLRVVPTAHLQTGKVIVMEQTAALVYDRQAVTVEMGYVNDDFTKNLVTIRAEERLALGCERPAGIYYGDFTA